MSGLYSNTEIYICHNSINNITDQNFTHIMEHKQTKERTYSIEIGKVKVEVPLEADACLLCANELKAVAIGECGHHVICYVCMLRLRWVMNKSACPVCKTHLDTLIITSNLSATFEDLIGKKSKLIQDKSDPNVYFEDKEAYDHMVRLRGYYCLWRGCGKYLYDQKGLESHLKSAHNRVLCDICFKNRPVFIGEQLIYPSHKLQEHMKYGEYRGDLMIKPHPFCVFCNKYFYTEEPLLNHLSKIHMNCHLCPEKYKYMYYKDYKDLELHFQKSHYLCPNETCRAKCFVVFGTLEELHIHNHKEHGGFGPSKGLKLDALKVGLFSSGEDIPTKDEVNDGVGVDFSQYFSPEYYSRLREEHEEKREAASQRGKGEDHRRRGGRYGARGGYHGPTHGAQHVQYLKKEYVSEDIHKEEVKEKPVEHAPVTSKKEQCIEQLRNEIYHLIKKKLALIGIEKVECNFEKEQLYQLSKLIDNMSIESISQCEFLMNFGISLSLKKHLSYLIQNNNGHISDEEELAALSIRELLIIYKYFDIAVQKIHKKFIRHELADINPDLLADFKQKPAKAKEPKFAVDYRDALKPKINYEDAKAFPELQSITKKSQVSKASGSIWQKLEKPSLGGAQPGTEKTKKKIDEEFPALPEQKPTFIKEKKKVVEEIKKIPEAEAWPTFKDVKEEEDRSGPKGKGRKERKKKSQGKAQPYIQMGFYQQFHSINISSACLQM
eukprot:TRINITY_DN2107_c0_g1_i1.p2 TRINITY_DN2107_c0_g1~~TRINITY_DN2107_c0_g1_i1.p2  ORF type:complete len:721 (-),score=101.04 TRINITY_DN2107_c0_g1_i1:11556-13718(-)